MSRTRHHGHALPPRRALFLYDSEGYRDYKHHPLEHELDRAPVSRGELDVDEFWEVYRIRRDGTSYLDYVHDRVPALWEALRTHHRGRRRSGEKRAVQRAVSLAGARCRAAWRTWSKRAKDYRLAIAKRLASYGSGEVIPPDVFASADQYAASVSGFQIGDVDDASD